MELTNSAINMTLSSSEFRSQLLLISTDIVWKNSTEANKNENSDFRIETEIFISACKGMLTFETIFQFTPSSLNGAGIIGNAMHNAMDDKNTIPKSLRPLCVSLFIKELMQKNQTTGRYITYNEPNNYYRMLFGLPNIETKESEYLYNTKYSDITTTTPVHLLSLPDRFTLEARGYFDELLNKHPTYKYLNYLGSKCIDIYEARCAEKFAILYIDASASSSNLINDFKDVYNNCRRNMIRVYYTDAFKKDNAYYDGFAAMCILFMTIQLMHYKYLSADIDRDFYDLESIKYIYDAYGVPFYRTIPLEYHRKIVMSINRLLSYKGSTRVFYELFDLFDYGSMDVFEYYLLKTHRFDEFNRPIFANLPDGNPDNRSMYDIKFGKVKLYNDPPLELSNVANHLTYYTMTANDPYWISDEELLDKIYNDMDFNYLESKYIGIQTIFDMMQIVYESCYFFKMITDKRADLSGTSLTYAPLNKSVSLFSLIIYISALICKKYGYAGNISTHLPFVGKVLGFDFKKDLNTIRNYIKNNAVLSKDSYLDNLFINMNINNIQSVNSTFKKISDLRGYFADKFGSVKTREEYFAYYEFQKMIMISDVVEKSYKKSNGKTAESFSDLLSDLDSGLYLRLISEEIVPTEELDIALNLLKISIGNLKYIEYSDGIDISVMIEHLFKLLNFFKSAKSELTGYNIVYTLSSRGINFFRMIDEINIIKESSSNKDRLNSLTDLLGVYYNFGHIRDKLEYLVDTIKSYSTIVYVKEYINEISDYMRLILDTFEIYKDEFSITDILIVSHSNDVVSSLMSLHDKAILSYEDIDYEMVFTKLMDKFEYLIDSINRYNTKSKIPDKLLLKSKINKISETYYMMKNDIPLNDNLRYSYVNNYIADTFDVLYSEITNIESNSIIKDNFYNIIGIISSIKDNMIVYDEFVYKDIISVIKETDKTIRIILDLKDLVIFPSDELRFQKYVTKVKDKFIAVLDEINKSKTNIVLKKDMTIYDSITKLSEMLIQYKSNFNSIKDDINKEVTTYIIHDEITYLYDTIHNYMDQMNIKIDIMINDKITKHINKYNLKTDNVLNDILYLITKNNSNNDIMAVQDKLIVGKIIEYPDTPIFE